MVCWKSWWPLSSTYSWDKECKDLMFQVPTNPYGMLLTHKNDFVIHVLLMDFRWDKKLKFRFMITVTCLSLASCSAYNSILKMEMQCCYKTMMDFYQTTWVYNREKLTPHIKHKRSLKVVVQPLVFVAHPYTYILLILRVPQIILRQIKITNVTVFLHRCNCWNFTLYTVDQQKLL